MVNILIPGRHHILTNYQFNTLNVLIKKGLQDEPDVNGTVLGIDEVVERLIFPVTSANHSNTRRNPLPLIYRAMAIQNFARDLETPTYVFPIEDIGTIDDFGRYTVASINHSLDGLFNVNPDNTVILCSTPVMEMYEKEGFRILPGELDKRTYDENSKRMSYSYSKFNPWEIVEMIGTSKGDWKKNDQFLKFVHPASQKVWETYDFGKKVRILFNDHMLGDDGDLTETREYDTYVRQMDEIAELKFKDTVKYIKPGRIGDIGCAVGSWIRLASRYEEPGKNLTESDFYGIEASRKLYDLCMQRKENGEFRNPYVFFSKKNAVTDIVFDKESMDTIHTSSLTHEIESYGGHNNLLRFIKNRFDELRPGGVWINRDVIGPENGDREIYMSLNEFDGRNEDVFARLDNGKDLAMHLSGLSTYSRFRRFAEDFRHNEGYHLQFSEEIIGEERYVLLKLRDACEFMSKKDYVDNWNSEMHETFCYFDISDWSEELKRNGFTINKESRAYTNDWIVKNRLDGKVGLYEKIEDRLSKIDYPVTNMILIAERR